MIDKIAFFAGIRGVLFPSLSQSQVDGINAILDVWVKDDPGVDKRWIAYSLATAYRETAATMKPIEEYGKGRGHPYGNPAGVYRQIYDGRGLVQLTWESNYKNATSHLRARGVLTGSQDLDAHPELALDPTIAAAVLVFGMTEGWFTGVGLGHYFGAATNDAINARRIINGTDHAAEIAGHHYTFLKALSH